MHIDDDIKPALDMLLYSIVYALKQTQINLFVVLSLDKGVNI